LLFSEFRLRKMIKVTVLSAVMQYSLGKEAPLQISLMPISSALMKAKLSGMFGAYPPDCTAS